MATTILLRRHPDPSAGFAKWLDLTITGGTPGATIRMLVGGVERGTDTLDGNGELERVGDPDASGTGIPVSPGGMRNNLKDFNAQGNTYTEHPGQGFPLLAGEFGGGGNWYIEEQVGTP